MKYLILLGAMLTISIQCNAQKIVSVVIPPIIDTSIEDYRIFYIIPAGDTISEFEGNYYKGVVVEEECKKYLITRNDRLINIDRRRVIPYMEMFFITKSGKRFDEGKSDYLGFRAVK